MINADYCTGCEACIAVCPVDCIELLETGLRVKGVEAWCEVDLDRCIGCTLCVRLPKKSTDAYEMKICPWDAIEMVPPEKMPEAIAQIGGPPAYFVAHQQRLLEAAQRSAEGRRAQRLRG